MSSKITKTVFINFLLYRMHFTLIGSTIDIVGACINTNQNPTIKKNELSQIGQTSNFGTPITLKKQSRLK